MLLTLNLLTSCPRSELITRFSRKIAEVCTLVPNLETEVFFETEFSKENISPMA